MSFFQSGFNITHHQQIEQMAIWWVPIIIFKVTASPVRLVRGHGLPSYQEGSEKSRLCREVDLLEDGEVFLREAWEPRTYAYIGDILVREVQNSFVLTCSLEAKVVRWSRSCWNRSMAPALTMRQAILTTGFRCKVQSQCPWLGSYISSPPCFAWGQQIGQMSSWALLYFGSVRCWCDAKRRWWGHSVLFGPDWQNSSLMHGWGLGKPHHARHMARLQTASCQSGSFRSGGGDRASKAQTQKGGQPAPSPIATPAAPNLQRWFGHKVLSQCPTERQLSWTICLDIFLPGHLFHIRRGHLCTCHHPSWTNNFRKSFLSRMFNKKTAANKIILARSWKKSMFEKGCNQSKSAKNQNLAKSWRKPIFE